MKSYRMYVIIFGFVILKFQISVSDPQFPPHIDLQKVGEAIFNNEKFNILKPTSHLVTDHFKEVMLRQDSTHPGERVFIDKNGFRHAWADFGDKSRSLRKTDLKHISGSFEKVAENTPGSDVIPTDDNDNTTPTVEDTNVSNNESVNNNEEEEENDPSDNNEAAESLTEEEDTETPDSKETTTTFDEFLGAHDITSSKPTIEQRLRSGTKKPKAAKKSDAKPTTKKSEKPAATKKPDGKPAATKKADDKPAADKKPANKPDEKKPALKQRSVATTTFFCPFFGVIKMSAFID